MSIFCNIWEWLSAKHENQLIRHLVPPTYGVPVTQVVLAWSLPIFVPCSSVFVDFQEPEMGIQSEFDWSVLWFHLPIYGAWNYNVSQECFCKFVNSYVATGWSSFCAMTYLNSEIQINCQNLAITLTQQLLTQLVLWHKYIPLIHCFSIQYRKLS